MNLLSHALFLILFCFPRSYSDHTSLVYKNCSQQSFHISSTKAHSQALSSLFRELVSRSSDTKFFKTTEAAGGDNDAAGESAVFGLFQCREELTNEVCRSCVRALPEISSGLCGGASWARVQRRGCYLRYEPDGLWERPDESALLHKDCEEPREEALGFREMRDAALLALEDEMVERSGGFWRTGYELVRATAQCEGDVGACECGECVSKAVLIAREECGGAFAAEIYMDKCVLSYAYYPQGLPDDDLNPGERESKDGNGNNGRTMAIVLGGAAALCFGLIFVLFIKSWTKKDDD